MGNGPSSYASARASAGINSSRGTFAMAESTRSSLILRGDSHLPKDNAACGATKAAEAEFSSLALAHRRNGVHVTQAIGQNFHHMRRKMRRLLNEKMKPAPVDLRQARGGLCHSVGRPRTVINQRHLTKERAR